MTDETEIWRRRDGGLFVRCKDAKGPEGFQLPCIETDDGRMLRPIYGAVFYLDIGDIYTMEMGRSLDMNRRDLVKLVDELIIRGPDESPHISGQQKGVPK